MISLVISWKFLPRFASFVYSINSIDGKIRLGTFYEVSNETIIEAPLELAINDINEEREKNS